MERRSFCTLPPCDRNGTRTQAGLGNSMGTLRTNNTMTRSQRDLQHSNWQVRIHFISYELDSFYYCLPGAP